VSVISDVPRWTAADADVPGELGNWLRAGRDDVGTSDEVAELARRVSAALGPAAGLPSGPEPALEPDLTPAARPPASGPSLRGDVGGSAARLTSGVGVRWAAWTITGIGSIAAVWWAIGALSSVPPETAMPMPAAGEAAPTPAAPAPTPAPELSEPSRAARAAAHSRRAPRAPATRATRAGGEAGLLERAQAALEHRPAEALRLSGEHEARFPQGALVQEREVIAIEALNRLGRTAAAQARAARFERRFRGSVHQPRLERATDTSPPGEAGAVPPAP
jgi:hypothetical protein